MTPELTIGAPIAVHPQGDPLDDMEWADEHPEIEAAWLIDHLQGWFPRGAPGGVLDDPHQLLDSLSLLAAGASRTSRVALGVAVTDPVRRSTVALAQYASTVSWLGNRPMRLGLGVGDPGQLQPYGLHPGLERTGRLNYLRPALEQLAELRGKRADDRSGAPFGIAQVAPFGLYLAAHGPKMLELTARHADGWVPSSIPPQVYGQKLTDLRAAAERFGRDPNAIDTTLFVWSALGSTEAESAALLRHPSVRAVALYRGPSGFARHGAEYPLDHGYIPHLVDPERARGMLEAIPDGVVSDAVLHGSPEQVRERLEAYREAGCRHVICYDIGRFVDPEGTARFRESLLQVAKL